jgi:predicted amidohydrolase YtcJ
MGYGANWRRVWVSLIFRDAEVSGRLVTVKVSGPRVVEVGDDVAPSSADEVIDAGGGALLPGLHDHHLHLMAMAAADESLLCGPPDVSTRAELEATLGIAVRELAGDGWVRGVGYHESVAGLLDRDALDRVTAGVPVRIQHRGGALWILNSAAIERLGLESESALSVDRDAAGRLTGRLWRGDQLLRQRLGATPPDLARVGARLASYGVTGVTDATWTNDDRSVRWIADQMPQRVRVMGPCSLDAPVLTVGEVKVMLDDDALPSLDSLARTVLGAHAADRAVAVHCVTAAQLFLALHAFDEAGVRGDRIEHASVVLPEARLALGRLGLRVVTQPGLVGERGDRYRQDVDDFEREFLYPLRSLLDAGIPVAGSTDAPLTSPDPWAAMRAAVDRRAVDGEVLSPRERLTPPEALALFLRPAQDVGARPKVVRPGADADLVLLAAPLDHVLRRFDAGDVVLTMIAGNVAHDAR